MPSHSRLTEITVHVSRLNMGSIPTRKSPHSSKAAWVPGKASQQRGRVTSLGRTMTITSNTAAVTQQLSDYPESRRQKTCVQRAYSAALPSAPRCPPCEQEGTRTRHLHLHQDANGWEKTQTGNVPYQTLSSVILSMKTGGGKSQRKIWNVAKEPKEGERHIHTNPPRSKQRPLPRALSHTRAHAANTCCQYQQ